MEYTLESLREHEMFRWFIEISSVPRARGTLKPYRNLQQILPLSVDCNMSETRWATWL